MKVLLDAGSQWTYNLEKIRKFLKLSTEAVEDVNISTFGNSQTLSKSIDPVLLVAKTSSHKNMLLKLCVYVMFTYIESKYHISKGRVSKISWNRICRRGQWKVYRFVERLWFVLKFCHRKYSKVWGIRRFHYSWD